MELFNLTGRSAIITGGNKGIGFAATKGLSAAGASVVIANRCAGDGEWAPQSLREEGFGATAVQTDGQQQGFGFKLISAQFADIIYRLQSGPLVIIAA